MKANQIHYLISLSIFVCIICFSETPAANELMEEMSLKKLLSQTVTTATLSEMRLDKVPSSMSVITEEDIKKSGARDIFELLDKVRGIAVRATSAASWIKSVNLRGTTANYNKVKFLIDGHDIQGPHFDDQTLPLSLENVKQVEIIRGPGSCLYGANAFAGVINIISKEAGDIDGTQLNIKYGSFNTKHADMLYGKVFEHFELVLNANYMDADDYGAKLDKDGLYGSPVSLSPGEMDAGKRNGFNGSITIRYKQLKTTLSYFDAKGYSAVNLLGFLTQDGEYARLRYGYMDMEYTLPTTSTFQLKLKGTYDHMTTAINAHTLPNDFKFGRDVLGLDIDVDTNNDGIYENFPEGAIMDQGYKARKYGAEIMGSYKFSYDNVLTGGIFYQYTQTGDHFYETNLDTVDFYKLVPSQKHEGDDSLLPESEREIYGIYLQDEWDIAEDWYMVIGARYDQYDDFGDTLNPRCSIVYTFDHENVGIIKLIYGTAFKAPTLGQLYLANSRVAIGNPELKPESITSYEISLGYLFFRKLKTNLAVYQLHTNNLIDSLKDNDPETPSIFINSGKSKTWGIETELRYIFKENDNIYVTYDYTNSKDDRTDETYSFMPDTQISGGLNLNPWHSVFWNVNIDYVGRMKREKADTRGDIDPVSLVDTTVLIETYKGWTGYISVHNIMDEDHIQPTQLSTSDITRQVSDIPKPGRDITVGMRIKF